MSAWTRFFSIPLNLSMAKVKSRLEASIKLFNFARIFAIHPASHPYICEYFLHNCQTKDETPRLKREANPGHHQHLTRNDQDETYYTMGRHYVRPSGLAEMSERLDPPQSRGYQSPPIDYSQQPTPAGAIPKQQIQTRASSGRAYVPPVQRMGAGSDQVRNN